VRHTTEALEHTAEALWELMAEGGHPMRTEHTAEAACQILEDEGPSRVDHTTEAA
jgi:hypothetical protein